MPTQIVCKQETSELQEGKAYRLLDETRDGYRILVGKVSAIFRKDLFFRPVVND